MLAIGTLLALGASSAAGWAVASHLATNEHHAGNPRQPRGALDLEMALHGHAHTDGTASHAHPVVASVAAPIPGNVLVQTDAIMGGTREPVIVGPGACGSLSTVGPTHDRPPRLEALSVLRI